MFQTIEGIDYFVVDLTEGLPPLPITDGGSPGLQPYAAALQTAIEEGTVKEPGKYAINITDSGKHWTIFKVLE